MKMRAEVVVDYADGRIAKAVAGALAPDNLKLSEGLAVVTRVVGDTVISRVELEGRIETLLATLDDLLACSLAAEIVL